MPPSSRPRLADTTPWASTPRPRLEVEDAEQRGLVNGPTIRPETAEPRPLDLIPRPRRPLPLGPSIPRLACHGVPLARAPRDTIRDGLAALVPLSPIHAVGAPPPTTTPLPEGDTTSPQSVETFQTAREEITFILLVVETSTPRLDSEPPPTLPPVHHTVGPRTTDRNDGGMAVAYVDSREVTDAAIASACLLPRPPGGTSGVRARPRDTPRRLSTRPLMLRGRWPPVRHTTVEDRDATVLAGPPSPVPRPLTYVRPLVLSAAATTTPLGSPPQPMLADSRITVTPPRRVEIRTILPSHSRRDLRLRIRRPDKPTRLDVVATPPPREGPAEDRGPSRDTEPAATGDIAADVGTPLAPHSEQDTLRLTS